jgi:hypothetical protein
MNRRGFLSLFPAAAAAAIVDPAELLWTRKKLISIPKPRHYRSPLAFLRDEYQREMNRAFSELAEQMRGDYAFVTGDQWTSGEAIRARKIYLSSRPPSSPVPSLAIYRELPPTDPDPQR